jgi:hypothetical protein
LEQARWPNPFKEKGEEEATADDYKVYLSLVLKFEVNVILKSPPPMMVPLKCSQ